MPPLSPCANRSSELNGVLLSCSISSHQFTRQRIDANGTQWRKVCEEYLICSFSSHGSVCDKVRVWHDADSFQICFNVFSGERLCTRCQEHCVAILRRAGTPHFNSEYIPSGDFMVGVFDEDVRTPNENPKIIGCVCPAVFGLSNLRV